MVIFCETSCILNGTVNGVTLVFGTSLLSPEVMSKF